MAKNAKNVNGDLERRKAILRKVIRKELSRRLGELFGDLTSYAELADPDIASVRDFIMGEVESGCAIFLGRMRDKVKSNPNFAFELPPTLE